MRRFASLLVLVLAWPAFGQSVSLPKLIEAKPSRPIFVSPIVDGDDLAWEIDSGLDDWVKLLPPEVAKNFGNSKIFYADKGTYTIRAWTAKVVSGKAKLSDVATCVIVVDGGGPKPPPPPPPPPPSVLQQTLQAAYALDADPDKASKVAALADLLANVVATAKGSGAITGTVAFAAYVHNAAELHKGIGPGAIPKTRAAVGVYLNSVLPRAGSTDEAYWTKASLEYGTVAQALKGVR